MRKQYYFRPSDSGLMAWDVHRLVSLTADFEHFDVSLATIRELDRPLWCNGAGGPATGREIASHVKLIQETDLNYPIILSQDGSVMDGMHRVLKAVIEGRDSIKAVQFKVDPEPDYVGVNPDELPY